MWHIFKHRFESVGLLLNRNTQAKVDFLLHLTLKSTQRNEVLEKGGGGGIGWQQKRHISAIRGLGGAECHFSKSSGHERLHTEVFSQIRSSLMGTLETLEKELNGRRRVSARNVGETFYKLYQKCKKKTKIKPFSAHLCFSSHIQINIGRPRWPFAQWRPRPQLSPDLRLWGGSLALLRLVGVWRISADWFPVWGSWTLRWFWG